jgi:rhodanese-related sulfurtransferase
LLAPWLIFFGSGVNLPQFSSAEYAGDLSVQDAWALLQSDPAAQLVDVRTAAEWMFVGLPDLSGVGRAVHCIEWQAFPTMAANPAFVAETRRTTGGKTDAPVLFLCRSGGRSRAAATAMAEAGYTRAYNIAGGFEGDLDASRHRGQASGWKAAGLPWKQS